MSSITRRTMVGTGMMAALGALMPSVGVTAFADEAASAEFVPGGGTFANPELTEGWVGTPAEIAELGGCTMPLKEINRRRKAYIESLGEFVKEDGTVVPAPYVRMRALIHTYGMGCGNTPKDNSFDFMMEHFTEDEAVAFTEMPMGIAFTPFDFSVESGRPLEECQRICKMFADRGFVLNGAGVAGDWYHHIPFFQGVVEYTGFINRVSGEVDPAVFSSGVMGADWLGPNNDMEHGTPSFYAMPLNEEVVSDEGGVLPYDDIMKVIDAQNSFGIAPCACRYGTAYKGGVEDLPTMAEFVAGGHEDYFNPLCNLRIETCLQLGEEADYWIEHGFARRITKEDAKRFMKRSADDGFILQSNFSKYTGTVCSCHADNCNIIGQWLSLGSHDAIGAAKSFRHISHYTLEVDFDSCAKCGSCEQRCPMHCITMDENGFPQVDPACFKCGQCAYVCPMGARKLAARPQEMNPELPRDFLDDSNMKAGYRFEHGLIH